MASGSTVSVTYIPWRFHVTKRRKLLCPSSCHVTPLTHRFFFLFSCCLAVCAVSPQPGTCSHVPNQSHLINYIRQHISLSLPLPLYPSLCLFSSSVKISLSAEFLHSTPCDLVCDLRACQTPGYMCIERWYTHTDTQAVGRLNRGYNTSFLMALYCTPIAWRTMGRLHQ